jgi:hypothetical protein
MKRQSVICLAVLFSLLACSEEPSVATAGSEFDGNLIGYWYRLDTLSGRTGRLYHNAFYISPEGEYHQAGVETAT